MSTKLTNPFDTEEYSANDGRMLQSRYGDRKRLAAELDQARDLVKKNTTLQDGSPNPNRIRYEMQEHIARLSFDMGYLLEKNRLQSEQIEMLLELFTRVSVLEGAYSHVMMKAGMSGLNEPTMALIKNTVRINKELETEVKELRAKVNKID